MSPSVSSLIRALGLVEHPEGGYFRETYRSGAEPMASRGSTDAAGLVIDTHLGQRNLLTSILWMPTAESPIGWLCRNESDHVHYYQLGAAVTYRVLHPSGRFEIVRVGPDVEAGDVLQLVVPRGAYKAAELTQGEFGLVGEAVGPGFDFRDFWWVREEQLMGSPHFDELRRFIKPDQRRDFEKFYG